MTQQPQRILAGTSAATLRPCNCIFVNAVGLTVLCACHCVSMSRSQTCRWLSFLLHEPPMTLRLVTCAIAHVQDGSVQLCNGRFVGQSGGHQQVEMIKRYG